MSTPTNAETLVAEPARTHLVRCGCGASIDGPDPRAVEFFMEHRECRDVLVADDSDEFGPGVEALVGTHLAAWAIGRGGRWKVYAASDGRRKAAPPLTVGSRRQAETVLQMIADDYQDGRRG
ncbi:hypothetical protein [Mycobacteroides abscessus]|uniref:hypothetical protein n=1 Tax=Mycobacteroides abscessus TaxID=36809 RepID=UPI00210843FF|nr:hypothetical protein [Mycobacteroides abscessus]